MRRKVKQGIYKQMQKFADLTRTMITTGKLDRAKKCFSIVESLYITGNAQTKSAISNVYIYSVSGVLEINHLNIEKLFPYTLKKEYIKQINAS